MLPLLRWILPFYLLLFAGLLSAASLNPEQVPELLKPWIDWALYDEHELDCPYQYNGKQKACRWPSRLELDINSSGGNFSQQWQVFSETRVRLPGDKNNWPLNVQLASTSNSETQNTTTEITNTNTNVPQPLLVEEKDGYPHVLLKPGTHTLTGEFRWNKLPKSLQVTPESGLVSLKLNGTEVSNPEFTGQGKLWLRQGQLETSDEDNLDIQVFRKIIDSHPIKVETSIRLRVSGKQRNTTLAPVLLDGLIPLEIDSPLPARLENSQQLELQLRPGEWTLRITGRSSNNRTNFAPPKSQAPWPQQEVWVFENDSAMRQVEVTGVNSIDPNQTRLPQEWKQLPAYLMNQDDKIVLNVLQRGAAQTSHPELILQREMWLDFSGDGYTLKDRITGNTGRETRLDVLPELDLGRVSIDGQPQFITRLQEDSAPGVELRSENLQLEAESRVSGAIATPPVNGWQQDMQQVNTTLHLPPGWKLFSASGTDNHPGGWLQSWSLLDLFLVLVIALGTGYLFGWLWGGLALLTLVFIWQESSAPQFIWLNLLAITALLRALPEGWLKRWLGAYRWLSLIVLALIVLPYLINTVRIGLYPQLAHQHETSTAGIFQTMNAAVEEEANVMNDADMGMMAQQSTRARTQVTKSIKQYAPKPAPRPAPKKKHLMKTIDPNSMIQTGPGLPDWRDYLSISLQWSGPVKPDEQTRLWLLGPKQYFLFQLIGIALLLVFSWRMVSLSQRFSWSPRKWLKPEIKAMLPLLILPALLFTHQPVEAAKPVPMNLETVPEQTLLDTLKERLTSPPDCLPQCAQIESMEMAVFGNTLRARLTVHANADTAIPLPGSADTWLAEDILINNRLAEAIQRDQQQQLWIALPAGLHQVELRGTLPKRNSVQIPLPLPPHYVSWENNTERWTLEGIRDNGTPESQLQLNRVLNEEQKALQQQEQSTLPTFVKIERRLLLGLDWQVETTVQRLAPMDTPLSLNIPLLPDEQPMGEQLSIRNQLIKINLAARQQQISWISRLPQSAELLLTAAQTSDYLESWQLNVSPIWHAQADGLAINRYLQEDGSTIPVWQPWPGEQLKLSITRPQGIPGQTVTILGSTLEIDSGKRANDVRLDLAIRSSRGVPHTLKLPTDAEVQELSIDGVAQRIRRDEQNINLTLRPGKQNVQVKWRENEPVSWTYRFPEVNTGLPSVNSRLQLSVPSERWVLWAHGPAMGPAVLFWGVLLALGILSLILGLSKLTPLKSWQWFLLGVGLSQTEPMLMLLVAGWLIALAMREKYDLNFNWWQFDLMQIALAGLTLVALLVLVVALSHGLLGRPEMQIAGNQSSAYMLNWYQDRSAETLPQPYIISVPLWVYRVLMLAWALWLAVAVLGWLRWGWQALNVGGLWRQRPIKTRPQSEASSS